MPKIAGSMTHHALLERIEQNLDQCDDPEWIAEIATKIIGPTIRWNPKKKLYEELES